MSNSNMHRELEDKESIQVIIRVRPLSDREKTDDAKLCIRSEAGNQRLLLVNGADTKSFAFDEIIGEEQDQEDVFQRVGRSSTTKCIEGYNCSIFAYGQTGAGKTFTMMGLGHDNPNAYQKRGLVPRTLEFLFENIAREVTEEKAEYLITCTFLEIYNEQIIDLLDKSNKNLQLREDLKKGVYVDGIHEKTITKMEEAMDLLKRGSKGRHVGSTFYNDTSSRSHSVFTLFLQSKAVKNSITNVKQRSFHFIDLAGSEKTKQSNGQRLKEGCSINKSLHVLGMVINSLVESTDGKSRHVGYRDSKLTFLLKDSLGGNSKTHLIANISPAIASYNETLSTLSFAKRVKLIKVNKALINEDAAGNMETLKLEIVRLKQELIEMKSGNMSHLASVDQQSELGQFMMINENQIELEKLFKGFVEDTIEKEENLQREMKKRDEWRSVARGVNGLLSVCLEQNKARQVRLRELASGMKDQQGLERMVEELQLLEREVMEVERMSGALQERVEVQSSQTSLDIGYRIDYLSELKRLLTTATEERQQLNHLIEDHSEESPRNRKIQMELISREGALIEKLEQLTLEGELLKQTNTQNDSLLKDNATRLQEYQHKIEVITSSHKTSLQETHQHYQSKISDSEAIESEMKDTIDKLTLELIQVRESINYKEEELITIKVENTHIIEQMVTLADKLEKAESTNDSYKDRHTEFKTVLSNREEEIYAMKKELEEAIAIVNTVEVQFEEEKVNNANRQQDAMRKSEESVWALEKKLSFLQMENTSLQSEKNTYIKRNEEFYQEMLTRESLIAELRVDIDGLNQRLELERHNTEKRLDYTRTSSMESTQKLEEQLIDRNNRIIILEHEIEKQRLQITSVCNEVNNRSQAEITLHDRVEAEINRTRDIEEEMAKAQEHISEIEENELKYLREIDRLARKESSLAEQLGLAIKEKAALQNLVKLSKTAEANLEEEAAELKEKLLRRESQLSRARDSHSKEVETLKEEFEEFRQRSQQHEVYIKQVFDECLGNKENILKDFKRHNSACESLLVEEKRKVSEQKGEIRDLTLSLKEAEEQKQQYMYSAAEKEEQLDELKEELMAERELNDQRMEERENNFNQFIERKNEDFESLEMELAKVLEVVRTKEKEQTEKTSSLEEEYYITRHNHQELLQSYEEELGLRDRKIMLHQQQAQTLKKENLALEYELSEMRSDPEDTLNYAELKENVNKIHEAYEQSKVAVAELEERLQQAEETIVQLEKGKCELTSRLEEGARESSNNEEEIGKLMREKELISEDLSEKIQELQEGKREWEILRKRDIQRIEGQFEDYKVEVEKQNHHLYKNYELLKEEQLKYGDLVLRYQEVSRFNEELLDENKRLVQEISCYNRGDQQEQLEERQEEMDAVNDSSDQNPPLFEQHQLQPCDQSASEEEIQLTEGESPPPPADEYLGDYETLQQSYDQLESQYLASSQRWQQEKESLELTIQSLSEEVEKYSEEMEKYQAESEGRQEEAEYIANLQHELTALKRERHHFIEEYNRVSTENSDLSERLQSQAERSQTKRTRRPPTSESEVTLKIQLNRKGVEMKEWFDGISEICHLLNLKGLNDTSNRQRIENIKSSIEGMCQEVGSLKKELRERDRELQTRYINSQLMSREFTSMKHKMAHNKPSRDKTTTNNEGFFQQLQKKMGRLSGAKENTNLTNRY